MKCLINKLFQKQEIVEGEHEKVNERTQKIKGRQVIYQYLFYFLL